ncbi:MAG: hypothetical protein RL693_584 [Verrucomicrobiota bacterium]
MEEIAAATLTKSNGANIGCPRGDSTAGGSQAICVQSKCSERYRNREGECDIQQPKWRRALHERLNELGERSS